MAFGFSDGAAHYRISLPVLVEPDRFDQAGTWHVLMRIGKPRVDRPDGGGGADDRDRMHAEPDTDDRSITESQRRFGLARAHALGTAPAASAASRGALPYSVVVHAYSSVEFRARAEQESFVPGSVVTLHASLTQSGLPIADAAVWATVSTPSGSSFDVELAPGVDGWQGDFVAAASGVYEARVRARGRTRAGLPVTREQLVTAVAWRGADRPGDPAGDPHAPSGAGDGDGGTGGGCHWCHLLRCVLGPDGAIDDRLLKRLAEAGIDVERLWKCLDRCCEGALR